PSTPRALIPSPFPYTTLFRSHDPAPSDRTSTTGLMARRDVLRNRHGALADERDGHRAGAHAVARDPASGVDDGRRDVRLPCPIWPGQSGMCIATFPLTRRFARFRFPAILQQLKEGRMSGLRSATCSLALLVAPLGLGSSAAG